MDIATIVGVIAGFACVIMSVVAGGDATMFVHVPSMAIVIGGMISATLIHFSLGQVLRILSVIKKTLFGTAHWRWSSRSRTPTTRSSSRASRW